VSIETNNGKTMTVILFLVMIIHEKRQLMIIGSKVGEDTRPVGGMRRRAGTVEALQDMHEDVRIVTI
jgi:hypothetical protein